jgi:hypothetical protein
MAEQPAPSAEEHTPRRAEPGELISALSALVLFVLMFAAKWYGVDQLPGTTSGFERVTSENAWDALTLLRWLMLLTIVVAIGALVLHATQSAHGTTTDTSGLITGLGTVTAILLIYRVLIDLPSANQVVDQKLGAMLGLLAALGIVFGGHASMRARRLKPRTDHRSRSQKTGVAAGPHAR